jgi:hypothetical protein
MKSSYLELQLHVDKQLKERLQTSERGQYNVVHMFGINLLPPCSGLYTLPAMNVAD